MTLTRFDTHPLVHGCPPAWASEWGEDEFGVFVGFTIGEATHRFRWCPPGEFQMGSPEGEEGRVDSEGPVHMVTISRGFWLGETPVTQDLWSALGGENPSRFKSPERPVETVSWHDAEQFIERLNKRVDGLDVRLPTEAEWEYACRADTTESTYAGDLRIEGVNDAPLLDEIAWYGGNSGVDFELDNPLDTSSFKQKQYQEHQAGTHPVRRKRPNRWGLHDMLGNVVEWCSDWWAEGYPGDKPRVDPTGPSTGTLRVCRGGSWINDARYCRSAARDDGTPDLRYGFLGFRLARGQCAPGQDQDGGAEEEPAGPIGTSRRGTRP